MLEDEKWDRGTSRKADDEQGTRKDMDAFDSGLYHETTISSREGYNISGI